jgi:hypothetical protein
MKHTKSNLGNGLEDAEAAHDHRRHPLHLPTAKEGKAAIELASFRRDSLQGRPKHRAPSSVRQKACQQGKFES